MMKLSSSASLLNRFDIYKGPGGTKLLKSHHHLQKKKKCKRVCLVLMSYTITFEPLPRAPG